uniref:Helitron helicase-like domain-containing protein n=1 Tax=Plectus sambesii TaxID=2011161 RepID=A0A914WQX2_9BILA
MLVWLQQHNPLYKNITIDWDPDFNNVVEEVDDSGNYPPPSSYNSKRSIAMSYQVSHFLQSKQPPPTVIDLVDVSKLNCTGASPLINYWISEDQIQGRVQQLLKQKDLVVERSLQSIFSNCCGSAQYWSRQMAHLMAMDANAGLTTFFVMLSCKKNQWDNMHEALMLLSNDLPNIHHQRQGLLCLKDLMTVSNQFYDSFKALMRLVILDKNGPFGEVRQLLVKRQREEVIKFIEKAITCWLPSLISSLTLYRLVVDNQMHKCCPFCQHVPGY